MKLIDKDKLVSMLKDKIADIELDMKCGFLKERKGTEKILILKHIISLINTLEVKEVNLDGISRHYALNNTPWDDCVDEIQEAYKAGFELGLKAQKGE